MAEASIALKSTITSPSTIDSLFPSSKSIKSFMSSDSPVISNYSLFTSARTAYIARYITPLPYFMILFLVEVMSLS